MNSSSTALLLIVGLLLRPLAHAHDWHRHAEGGVEPVASPSSGLPVSFAESLLLSPDLDGTEGAEVPAPPVLQASGPQPAGSLDCALGFARSFLRFTPSVRIWWDSTRFHVASDGIPGHNMMEGISAWQRQIPVPTYCFGTNDWSLPLCPVPAAVPLPIATNTFLQGAIALAANGIPIFNPANNRGEISAWIGELDRWGGHCGRADDYHYHAAPLHLTNVLGAALPIAFAMDGYPVYGLTEPDGSLPSGLDSFNGHESGSLGYHYHASLAPPFVNGGFHGQVSVLSSVNGQGQSVTQAGVQPRVNPPRPSGTALNGAFIQQFATLGPDHHRLSYSLPSNSPPTNYWEYSLDRAAGILRVTYADALGIRVTNYPNWRPAPDASLSTEPLVIRQPSATVPAGGSSLVLSVAAVGSPPLGFRWLRDGVELQDGPGVSGSASPTLALDPPSSGSAVSYSVLVSNALGTTVSTSLVAGSRPLRSVSRGPAGIADSNLYPPGQRVSAVGTVTALDGTSWTVPAETRFATGPRASDLYNDATGVRPPDIGGVNLENVPVTEVDPDGEVITGFLFADNYFELYVNGRLVAVDPVPFTPFNSSVVRFRARRPVTYALRLVDWEENLGLGTELNGGDADHPGDGGFIASFSDGTVTGSHWRAQTFYVAPLDDPAMVVDRADGRRDSSAAPLHAASGTNAFALHYAVPSSWSSPSFDDSGWPAAATYSEAEVGVDNKPAYLRFPAQFRDTGARFIWSSNLVLDNEVLVRFVGPPATANVPPIFLPASTNRHVIRAGESLSIPNPAVDADSPAQRLSYRILQGPEGAAIHADDGTVTWTPAPAQAGSSNLFRIQVLDSGSPAMDATREFSVFVRSSRPDVVVIVTDDHGYGDISSHGCPAATPNLDRLGAEGIRLERFYATPVCSVTRSALLTGRNPLRTQVSNSRGLDLGEHTLPETFRAYGYQTFMCGKWHLGGLYNTRTNAVVNGMEVPVVRESTAYQPQNRGWDVHYGEYTGAINYTTHLSQETGTPDWWLNGQASVDEGWSTDLLADRACDLMRQRDPSRPAVVYLAFNAVHGPVSAPAEYLARHASVAKASRRATLAALEQMDAAVGRVLGVIDSSGMRSNTLVVFFGDNGGQARTGGSNLPLRGDKGDLFDGGIHTPAAIRWPGVLPSGVTNCQRFVWVGDLFPTLCAAAGIPPGNTRPLDGENLWPRLLSASNAPFNPTERRAAPIVSGSSSGNAVLEILDPGTGPSMFKLIRDKLPAGAGRGFTNLLFDIIKDPLEVNDLAASPLYAGFIPSLAARIDSLAPEAYSPHVSVPPSSHAVPAGTNVTLWALATVYPRLVSCQWRKSGVAIPGATNAVPVDDRVWLTRLDISSVSAADAGDYDVVVTDAASGWTSSVASPSATLTVTGSVAVVAAACDVLIGRPTDTSIAVSLLCSNALQTAIEYGVQPGQFTSRTPVLSLSPGVPGTHNLSSLQPDRRHYYRVLLSPPGGGAFSPGPEGSFHTRRARGSTFTFAVEADPHHRDNDPPVWRLALTNILADAPDFLLDLGDTFMEEKVGITNSYYLTRDGIMDLHREVRSGFFSILGHSVPTFLVNGNHEAEVGWILRLMAITNNPAIWGVEARQRFFPVPAPGGFYSGAVALDPYTQGPRDGYYAFEWGDALIVALDPFWYTSPKPQQNGWSWTLGTNQYFWLKQTLETSTARFKFVFVHHLIGGGLGNQARGGLTHAPYFEWGGLNTNGTSGFAAERPGWPMPIRELLLRNGVQVLFHGHDHLYVKEDEDADGDGRTDLIYQEVPQPSRVLSGTNSAASYGYTNGMVIGNSGHIRVTVTPTHARVEYVRVYLPSGEGAGRTNRMVSHSYEIPAPVPASGWSLRQLPDTGQTADFTSVPGEDSDYSIHPPSLLDNGDGTISDRVTGLMWQKVDGGEMTWSNALSYAEGASLAGHTDWRLPNCHEIFSIMNHAVNNPALNIQFFPSGGGASAQYWWTQVPRADDPTRIWVANAGGGIGPHPMTETLSAGGQSRYHARLVRGAPAPVGSPLRRLVDNGDGTISDPDTGLQWQKAEVPAAMDWTNALRHAEALVLGGRSDWRLPNVKELQSIHDPTLVSPCFDVRFFPGARAVRYWSSTSQNNQPLRAWFMEGQYGIISQDAKGALLWVRAVRGPVTDPVPNTAPVLSPIPDRTVNPGQRVVITPASSDAESPPQTLRYSLISPVPAVSLDTTNGVFSWRPAMAHAGTSNRFTLIVSDDGIPSLNAFADFSVVVHPLATFRISGISAGPSDFRLLLEGSPGPDYTIQSSGDLIHWQDRITVTPASLPFEWADAPSAGPGGRFYRVLAGP